MSGNSSTFQGASTDLSKKKHLESYITWWEAGLFPHSQLLYFRCQILGFPACQAALKEKAGHSMPQQLSFRCTCYICVSHSPPSWHRNMCPKFIWGVLPSNQVYFYVTSFLGKTMQIALFLSKYSTLCYNPSSNFPMK